MTRAKIDFTISFESGVAFCQVVGHIESPATPVPGDTISLLFAPNGSPFPGISSFSGLLRVEGRIFQIEPSGMAVTVSCEELVLRTTAEAKAVLDYLEEGFGWTHIPF